MTRSEAKLFFQRLDINLDNDEVSCFKCCNPLYYKSYSYRCINNHTYNYQTLVFEYAKFLNDLKEDVADNKICCVQF
ncbi:MAG: hypothetical protein PHX44_01660 [Sulfurimonas sp.]|uniref:hypothetical protein n=1 Tax=Sulfurimonas sp. TaxID=2022749 RepID=UPI0026211433|nr:hypothetical protein [Sulfurimonas sp.]MDD2651724.1 hypothetical protein [Sulfurimonas sp.]MDD2651741.1 hypothetical protein [Sulfurimonas sp.]MDD3451707.1 hypothetical protein [Sulfurimonas sp.]MDD3451724.1 hypothetical protein [Sulfurimonas sp.]